MEIVTRRIYEEQKDTDDIRVLVDRLWPRGVSKEEANLNRWMKELTPSNDLQKWFDHEPQKWSRFKEKYKNELRRKEELLKELKELSKEDNLILLYAAKEDKYNNAEALKDFLKEEF